MLLTYSCQNLALTGSSTDTVPAAAETSIPLTGHSESCVCVCL